MIFILYKLYVLLPYTYPTPKLSPHRRRCISIFPQKNSLCMIYDLCHTHVIIQMCVLINHINMPTHTHTHTHTHTLSLSHTHTHTLSLSHTHTLSLSHTLTHTHTVSHTHTLSHTYTHTHTDLTQPVFALSVPESSLVLIPRPIEIHTAIHSPLNHL